MATTDYPVNHPSAVKLWSEKLYRESLKRTYMSKFIGDSASSIIQRKNNTQKSAGDKITCTLRMQLSGDGVAGDSTLEGNEEALTTYTDSLFIDQVRHAVRSSGKMSDQRVSWDVREEAMDALADWQANMIDTALFNQLSGNTGESQTKKTGSNATVAPSTNRIYYANGLANETQVASASASNVFKLKFIDYAVEKAKTASPTIRPLKINGEDKYVCFLHPYQVTSLRTDASTAGNWYDIQKAAMQGGDVSKNPIYTGALGEYNNTILFESTRVPLTTALGGSSTDGTYRAIFCGAQSAMIAFGQRYNGVESNLWKEETFDYGNQLGVATGLIWGAKKSIFNSEDFGTIVLATYAAKAF